jgi:SAM-dependent methyltransferase
VSDSSNDASRAGSAETKEFYETRGWAREDGKLVDAEMFGARGEGPIRRRGHSVRTERIRSAISSLGPVRLLECGCGGTPATFLADLCSHFVALDFSERGLVEAREALTATGIPFETQAADMCRLPYPPDSFDAVYSAHALYHIPSATAQAAAASEMLRVVRPGGVIVLILANPRPILSPLRLAKRLIADAPVVSDLANRLRPPPPLPYRPMSISWTRRQFRGGASVDVITYLIASLWLNQHVSEQSLFGSLTWRALLTLERNWPHLSAYLGNFMTVIARKNE